MLLGYDFGETLDTLRKGVVTLPGTGGGKASLIKAFLDFRSESMELRKPRWAYGDFYSAVYGSFFPERFLGRKDAGKTEKQYVKYTADNISDGNKNSPVRLSAGGGANKQKPVRISLAADVFRKVSKVDFPELKDADKAEYMFIKHAADSICSSIMGDPLETFRKMTKETQVLALQTIHNTYCRKLGFDGSLTTVALCNMENEKIQGTYQYGKKRILINKMLFDNLTSAASSEIVISTLIHETFHEFQMCAAFDSVKYSVRKEIVSVWRMNYGDTDAVNYIRYEVNPVRYAKQPVELYAKLVEKGTIQLLLAVSGSKPKERV